MQYIRHRLSITTDTGANGTAFSAPLYGELVQFIAKPADTGVRADTGLVLTLDMDTGTINQRLFVRHNEPNAANQLFSLYPIKALDTGGEVISNDTGGAARYDQRQPVCFAGEQIKASVQGIATDTGKEIVLYAYLRR